MRITRRELIRTVIGAAAVAALPRRARAAQRGADVSGIPEHVPMHPDLAMTRDAFEREMNEVFTIIRAGHLPFRLQLVAVRDSAAATAAGTRGSQATFSAFFIGPPDQWLPEGTYLLETPNHGRMALFFKQAYATPDATVYEVAFDRRTSDQTIDHHMRLRKPR